MKMEQLRELKHRHFLYNTTTGQVLVVATQASTYEVDESKIKAVCKVVADKDREQMDKEVIINNTNMADYENILTAIERVNDPHLFATLAYSGLIVDSISVMINQSLAAQRGGGGGIQL